MSKHPQPSRRNGAASRMLRAPRLRAPDGSLGDLAGRRPALGAGVAPRRRTAGATPVASGFFTRSWPGLDRHPGRADHRQPFDRGRRGAWGPGRSRLPDDRLLRDRLFAQPASAGGLVPIGLAAAVRPASARSSSPGRHACAGQPPHARQPLLRLGPGRLQALLGFLLGALSSPADFREFLLGRLDALLQLGRPGPGASSAALVGSFRLARLVLFFFAAMTYSSCCFGTVAGGISGRLNVSRRHGLGSGRRIWRPMSPCWPISPAVPRAVRST